MLNQDHLGYKMTLDRSLALSQRSAVINWGLLPSVFRDVTPGHMTANNQDAIYQVDRAIGQIRRGGRVCFETKKGQLFLFCAAEFLGRDSEDFDEQSSFFALPENRYLFLKQGQRDFTQSFDKALCLSSFPDVQLTAEHLTRDLASSIGEDFPAQALQPELLPILRLLKWAYALPVALIKPIAGDQSNTMLVPRISSDLLESYLTSLPPSIKLVSSAKLPIAATENAEILAYGSRSSAQEHFVLRIGSNSGQKKSSPLVRMHSECFTGDLLASLRCDCGSQLHSAIDLCVEAGFGLILYLHQEGRGIGLANKVRAYALQDQGLDTVQANAVLGFHPDERDFAVARAILDSLGISKLKLISNNPYKKESLEKEGFQVEDLVPLKIAATSHSKAYLETKVEKMGHKL